MSALPVKYWNPDRGAVIAPLFSNAGAPVNGTSGTAAGVAVAGALLVDTTNKNLYVNTNTKASPTWTLVGGATAGAGVAPAQEQAQPSNPTAPNSTSSFQMQGLAGAITPVASGTILLMLSGNLIASAGTVGDGIELQLSYGTGAAPGNNTALAGTQVGSTIEFTIPATATAADVNVPFSMQAVISGLTPGTPVWLDAAAKAIGAVSIVGLANLSLSAVEL